MSELGKTVKIVTKNDKIMSVSNYTAFTQNSKSDRNEDKLKRYNYPFSKYDKAFRLWTTKTNEEIYVV